MLHAPSRADSVQQVANHRPVDAAILRLGSLTQPRRQENMGWLQPLKRLRKRNGIKQVGSDRRDTRLFLRGPCKPEHVPAVFYKSGGNGAALDAGRADNKCCLGHGVSPVITRCNRHLVPRPPLR